MLTLLCQLHLVKYLCVLNILGVKIKIFANLIPLLIIGYARYNIAHSSLATHCFTEAVTQVNVFHYFSRLYMELALIHETFLQTDRAAMLDEIIDYVKFLRLQVKVSSPDFAIFHKNILEDLLVPCMHFPSLFLQLSRLSFLESFYGPLFLFFGIFVRMAKFHETFTCHL